MTAAVRPLVVALAILLAAVACTGGEPTVEPTAGVTAQATTAGADDADPAPRPDAEDDQAASGGGVPLAAGAEVDVDPAVLDAAGSWIREESGLSAMLQEEIFLSRVTRTRDVNHLLFVQQHDGVAVRGAQFVVHIRDGGEVIGASQSLTETLPGEGVREELDEAAAVDIATKIVPGAVAGQPEASPIWVEAGEELRLGWDVRLTTADPPSNYSVVVDAADGVVLSIDRLATDHGHRGGDAAAEVAQAQACDAPPPPSACVFPVDPIYASGDPTIDPTKANRTLIGVPLENLLDPSGPDLIGRYARIAPEQAAAYADPDGVWGEQGRGGADVTFEAGMTYHWIDYSQQLVQDLGYDHHADDPVDFVPIEPSFPDNAFYLFTEDRIHMGAAGDGVNEAEDAQGIIHEYGHAILQAVVPDILTAEGGAFHESVADLISVFTTLEYRDGDVACLFHWAERGQCLRRVDTDLVYPDDLRFEVHADGEIYNGAVWDVFEAALQRDTGLTPDRCQDLAANPCDAVRDVVYGTLLGSLPFLTPQLTLDDAATAFAVADRTFYDGVNADVIQQAFSAHGLAADGTPSMQIPGLSGDERSPSVVAVKILHPYRGDLAVSLDVVDADGQPLCAADLIAPDLEDSGDNITGRFDLVGSDCEPHLPPGPDRIWQLTVIDTAEEDAGRLFQFAVTHDGRRFIATGLPTPIPDADGIGITASIGGPAPTPTTDAGDAGGEVRAMVDIEHSYRGDLEVQVAVVDRLTDAVRCRVVLLAADPADGTDDVAIDADVSACGVLHPPTADLRWELRVADLAAADVGSVRRFALVGPDGTTTEADLAGEAGAIPDADARGIRIAISG